MKAFWWAQGIFIGSILILVPMMGPTHPSLAASMLLAAGLDVIAVGRSSLWWNSPPVSDQAMRRAWLVFAIFMIGAICIMATS